jgi:hypothetical protein
MLGACLHEGGCAIAVMAKVPRPGLVKTRLVPPLTPTTASALSEAFLRDITENIFLASRRCLIHAYVAYAPAGLEAMFDGKLATGTRLVLADGANISVPSIDGFGRCLWHAVQSLFARNHDAVCLLNSDSPTLPTALLEHAAEALSGDGDVVVLGPADDGGYYLIGMKKPHAHLFKDIAWSTAEVATQTRRRAQSLGLRLVELDPWYDVDDAASLLRLRRDLASNRQADRLVPYPAPVTATCLERLFATDEQEDR